MLLEKEKWLITSHFSFSHNVFNILVMQPRKNQGLFVKRLKLFVHYKVNFSLFFIQNICRQQSNDCTCRFSHMVENSIIKGGTASIKHLGVY